MEKIRVLIYLVSLISYSASAPLQHPDLSGEGLDEFDGFDAELMALLGEDFDAEEYSSDYIEALEPPTSYGNLTSYMCEQDEDCMNGGKCDPITSPVESQDKICHCTMKYVGSDCMQSRNELSSSIRTQPQFQDEFVECMGSRQSSTARSVLTKCVNQGNTCWYEKGGERSLKCFFWCVQNTLQVSVEEDTSEGKPRFQIYADVFRKLASEFSLATSVPEQPSPVYSMQVSLYGYPQGSQSNKPFSFRQSNTPNIFPPLRLSIETPNYNPYAQKPRLEDRNIVPGSNPTDFPENYFSHVVNPYKPDDDYEYTEASYPYQEATDIYPYGVAQGISEEPVRMHDDPTVPDQIIPEENAS